MTMAFFFLASGSTHLERLNLSDNFLFGGLPTSETQSSVVVLLHFSLTVQS